MSIREQVVKRAGGACEVMVLLRSGRYTRCGRSPVEDHHALTRARGGDLLDSVGEIYHHIALCSSHHREVYFIKDGIIDGYVYRDGPKIVYTGPDEYLTGKYGKAL